VWGESCQLANSVLAGVQRCLCDAFDVVLHLSSQLCKGDELSEANRFFSSFLSLVDHNERDSTSTNSAVLHGVDARSPP
jgi:hypothetical protein